MGERQIDSASAQEQAGKVGNEKPQSAAAEIGSDSSTDISSVMLVASAKTASLWSVFYL